MPRPTKILKWFVPQSLATLFVYACALPFIDAFSSFGASLLPDHLYYTPLSFYAGGYEITPILLIAILLAWPILNTYMQHVHNKKPFLHVLASVLVYFGLIPLILMIIVGNFIDAPPRYNIGHPACTSPFIDKVARCEGRIFVGFGDSVSGLAILGHKRENFEQLLSTSDYRLEEIACSDLWGHLGERCYTEVFPRINEGAPVITLYTSGALVLVLKTQNAPYLSDSDDPSLARAIRARYERYFDIERFRANFSPSTSSP